MTRYIVEMYGLSSDITQLREVEIELEDGASLGEVVGTLRRKIPALGGMLFVPEEAG